MLLVSLKAPLSAKRKYLTDLGSQNNIDDGKTCMPFLRNIPIRFLLVQNARFAAKESALGAPISGRQPRPVQAFLTPQPRRRRS